MSFLWPSLFPKAACCNRNDFMLEINAWKREKDLSHQQQSRVLGEQEKITWQPNLYSALNGSTGVFLNPSNPISLALFLHICWPTLTALKNTWPVTLARVQLHRDSQMIIDLGLKYGRKYEPSYCGCFWP